MWIRALTFANALYAAGLVEQAYALIRIEWEDVVSIYRRAFDELSASFNNLSMAIGVLMLPVLNNFIDALREFDKEVDIERTPRPV